MLQLQEFSSEIPIDISKSLEILKKGTISDKEHIHKADQVIFFSSSIELLTSPKISKCSPNFSKDRVPGTHEDLYYL